MINRDTALAFLNTVIEPALQAIHLWSPSACQLLLGTAIQESGLCHRRQMGGGPALGLWQMEPPTYNDCYDNYLKYTSKQDLLKSLLKLAERTEWPEAEWLVTHDKFACGMARVKYLRAPTVLPGVDDIAGQAAYWKQWYNTPLGAGTVDEYIRNWQQVMG